MFISLYLFTIVDLFTIESLINHFSKVTEQERTEVFIDLANLISLI